MAKSKWEAIVTYPCNVSVRGDLSDSQPTVRCPVHGCIHPGPITVRHEYSSPIPATAGPSE